MSRSVSTVLFHGQNVTGKGCPKHVEHTCSF